MSWTIVTPSFNQGAYLRRTLDSVAQQKGSFDLEHFIFDPGSQDNSRAIITEFVQTSARTNYRVQEFFEPDRGQAHAINRGFEKSQADFVGFLNSDDLLLSAYSLQSVTDAFIQHPEAQVIYGNGIFIDKRDELNGLYHSLDIHQHNIFDRCFLCQPSVFLRRSTWIEAGPFNEKLQNSFDYEYWIRLFTRGVRFRYIPDFLGATRLHEETKSQNVRAARIEDFAIIKHYGGTPGAHLKNEFLAATRGQRPGTHLREHLPFLRQNVSEFLPEVEEEIRVKEAEIFAET